MSYKNEFKDGWGEGMYLCGKGTDEKFAKPARKRLQEFLDLTGSRTLNEIGCGDLAWHGDELPCYYYFGMDLHERESWSMWEKKGAGLIKGDITTDDLYKMPIADMTIARDVFIHLSNDLIFQCLERLKKRSIYLVASTNFGKNYLRDDREKKGYLKKAYDVDLSSYPFNLICLSEHQEGKHLALFDL